MTAIFLVDAAVIEHNVCLRLPSEHEISWGVGTSG